MRQHASAHHDAISTSPQVGGLFLWDGLNKAPCTTRIDSCAGACKCAWAAAASTLTMGSRMCSFRCTSAQRSPRRRVTTSAHITPAHASFTHCGGRIRARRCVRAGWNGTAAILAVEAAGAVGASFAVAFENDSASATAAVTTTTTATTTTTTYVTAAMSVTGALLAAAGGTMPPDPSDPQRCAPPHRGLKGDPCELIEGSDADADERRWAASSLPRPAPADTCAFASWEDDAALRSLARATRTARRTWHT